MQLNITILDKIFYYSLYFGDLEDSVINSWISFDLASVLNNSTLISIYNIVDALAGTDYVEQFVSGNGPINVTTIENYADITVNLTAESIKFGAGQGNKCMCNIYQYVE